MIRWATISLLAGLLAIGVLYDRSSPQLIDQIVPGQQVVQSPIISRPGGLTSVWYCPVGSSSSDGYADHQIAITNSGDETAVANLTVITEDGPGITQRQEVQPNQTAVVELASLASNPVASALVEIVGGEGLVGHTVTTDQGPATGPCATEASDRWLLAGGATSRDARYYMVLMNPFGEDAVFDAEFRTDARTRRPIALQSDVVKGRSTKVIDITEHVSRAEMVSAVVNVTVGRLVVERLQTFDGVLGPQGAAITLAVATPQTDWFFPAGRVIEGGDHRLVIYNPAETSAEVDVSFMFEDPEEPTAVGLVPIELTIAPGRFELIDVGDLTIGLGLELPLDVGMMIQAADGSEVVAERWQMSPPLTADLLGSISLDSPVDSLVSVPDLAQLQQVPEEDPVGEGADDEHEDVPESELDIPIPKGFSQPSATIGLGISRGVSELATEWLVPRTEMIPGNGTAVVVSSIEGANVEVRLMVGGNLQPPIRATVPAMGRIVVSLGSSTTAAPIVVTASAPVAVEVQLVDPGRHLDVAPAVPVMLR